jgi:hypothetical protein
MHTKQHVILQADVFTLPLSASFFFALSCAYEAHAGHVTTPLLLVAAY